MEKIVVDQKEYLKKYLASGYGDDKKKKKKKRTKVGPQTVKIIDDDINLMNMRPVDDNEFDIFIGGEDAPQIAGVVDERGPVDFTDKRRWKIVANDEGGDLTITSTDKENKKSKQAKMALENDSSPPRKQRQYSDDDLSPPRTHKKPKDASNRKSRRDEDSDLSPPRMKAKKHIRSKHKMAQDNNDSDSGQDTDLPPLKSKKKSRRKEKMSDDSDLSPPRKSKKHKHRDENNSDSDISVPRKGKNYDLDLSPPRKCKKHKIEKIAKHRDDSDLSPHSRNKIDSDSDLSPPRKSKKHKTEKNTKHRDGSDLSPPRKNKIGSDSDLSPPRKSKKHKIEKNTKYRDDTDLSPPRKNKIGSDSDLSPPRRARGFDSNLSPLRKIRKDSDSDLSPPRKRKIKNYDLEQNLLRKNKSHGHRKRDSDSDLSPSRSKNEKNVHMSSTHKGSNYESHISPSRQNKKYKESYSDARRGRHIELSPSRQYKYRDERIEGYRVNKYCDKNSGLNNRSYNPDMSPSRKKNRDINPNSNRSGRDDRDFYKSKTSKFNDRHHRDSEYSHKQEYYSKENRPRHRDIYGEANEKRMRKTLDGRKAGLQDAKALREETEAHKKRETEQFSKLSKEVTGVGQAVIVRDTKTGRKRNLEAEAAEEREKQKRQAELDEKYAKWGKGLKQVEDREEQLKDDMYEMSKPLARYADDADLDKRLRDQDREGDPMLDYIKQKQIKEGKRKPDAPRYGGSSMPNRFGVKPGYRWDGVDRSNGYEKRWFEAQNAKVALQEEAYKWSTSDM